MYLWELCLCLWDTDPEPEYQGHWHYEDPEGNSESACLLYAEEVNQNSFSLLIKEEKLQGQIYTYSMWGHLVVFAQILGSNQRFWDSFSSLEEYSWS